MARSTSPARKVSGRRRRSPSPNRRKIPPPTLQAQNQLGNFTKLFALLYADKGTCLPPPVEALSSSAHTLSVPGPHSVTQPLASDGLALGGFERTTDVAGFNDPLALTYYDDTEASTEINSTRSTRSTRSTITSSSIISNITSSTIPPNSIADVDMVRYNHKGCPSTWMDGKSANWIRTPGGSSPPPPLPPPPPPPAAKPGIPPQHAHDSRSRRFAITSTNWRSATSSSPPATYGSGSSSGSDDSGPVSPDKEARKSLDVGRQLLAELLRPANSPSPSPPPFSDGLPAPPPCKMDMAEDREAEIRGVKARIPFGGALPCSGEFAQQVLGDFLHHDMQLRERFVDGLPDIHVFIDWSNISISLWDTLRVKRGINNNHQRFMPISFDRLVHVLERGRSTAVRELAGSRKVEHAGHYFSDMKERGYNTSILRRVRVPSPPCSPPGSSGSPTLPPSPRQAALDEKKKMAEQCVDEILQLKMSDSLIQGVKTRSQGIIVLATGDANKAEFSKGGFLSKVQDALELGWIVELYAFKQHTSGAWNKADFQAAWEGKFSIHYLDAYADRLIDQA
ncbi:hypothetical protein SODALDRAFT_176447 [Sodiomyces alkalinus F11]|uniref:NYN domain-containing protein n=1 Tax=Sodiomyces alkalinus (strain CBS 110278 / VKM F-3762 / F11) TaxID=1314773 RepID=A0A3N2PTS6_SODAK|nr:hypothetical protein SODALDRAFT_176447 [Sodiomyces alkalinus F11]ROT37891.1 hypothetical protein SODALDRAFT_176447 [Sodiomyces alkalinus F11]